MNQFVSPSPVPVIPALLEFFAATHTRQAYARTAEEFRLGRDAGVLSIAAVQPMHVATWIELARSRPLRRASSYWLAAICHLFDWLVTGPVVPVDPAGSMRGPRHAVTCEQTSALPACAIAR